MEEARRKKRSLRVAEIYRTIQGESTCAGLPCVHVRLAGCNLHCTYCDTPQSRSDGEEMAIEEILRKVHGFGTRLVEVTGGEPLLQEGTPDLLKALLTTGATVLLETNGSLPVDSLPPEVVKIYDMKCPGSGESDRNRWENLQYLTERDQIKFVLCDRTDYEWARETIDRFSLAGFEILLSPVHGKLESRELASWILEDGLDARINLQIHKIIWPEGEPK